VNFLGGQVLLTKHEFFHEWQVAAVSTFTLYDNFQQRVLASEFRVIAKFNALVQFFQPHVAALAGNSLATISGVPNF